MKRYFVATMMIAVLATSAFAAGRQDTATAYGRGRQAGGRQNSTWESTPRFEDSILDSIDEMELGELSQDEIDGLLLMREEEKLARDVYAELYEVWNYPIFSNISSSERQHMDSVGLLVERYDLVDPVGVDLPGVFESATLQALYDDLLAEGRTSLLAALTVGATIEDLDIADLHEQIEVSDNDDINLVCQNLLKGSRNHMRAFASLIDRNGGEYEPAYISEDELARIVASDIEAAPVSDPDHSF